MCNYKENIAHTLAGQSNNASATLSFTVPALQFEQILHLQGPNRWTYRAVIEATVNIGILEDYPSNLIPGFYERLTGFLPSLVEHQCSIGERGGFLQRLREGTWAAHILEHITLELQNLAGSQTSFGKARETDRRGVYKVAFRTRHEKVGRAALQMAHDLLLAAINHTPYDLTSAITQLTDLVDRWCLGPSTANIVDAATARNIPHLRLNGGNLVQLGYGSRQRRIWTAETDRTSAIAETTSRDKDLTKSLLASCGVPVPQGEMVDSPAAAWQAAQSIGLPVVVKPYDGNHGRGVSLDLRTQAQVEAAYAVADAEGSGVIVERFIHGTEYRLLIVGKRMVAATQGEIASVIGNGRDAIHTLIADQLNTDPRRGEAELYPLSLIEVDTNPLALSELQRQGFTPNSIPADAQSVVVLRTGNMSIDVTDDVHPDTAELAALAARVIGLDIAGIDLVVEDIRQPLHAQGGAIVEVNAGPSLLMHLKPAVGTPRPVGSAIVDHLFAQNTDDGRIPIIGVVGDDAQVMQQDDTVIDNNPSLIARLIGWLLQKHHLRSGVACDDGLYLQGRNIESQATVSSAMGERLLLNRALDAAVIQSSPLTIATQGLPYDRCDIAVVTSMGNLASVATQDITTPEQLRNITRTQIDVVRDNGTAILNAEEDAVAELASLCDGSVIYYAMDRHHPRLVAHREAGGRVVFIQHHIVVLADGEEEHALLSLNTLKPRKAQQPKTIMAAAAAGWALNIPLELIAGSLRSFDSQATH
jgi:cyanophycin synthetase